MLLEVPRSTAHMAKNISFGQLASVKRSANLNSFKQSLGSLHISPMMVLKWTFLKKKKKKIKPDVCVIALDW